MLDSIGTVRWHDTGESHPSQKRFVDLAQAPDPSSAILEACRERLVHLARTVKLALNVDLASISVIVGDTVHWVASDELQFRKVIPLDNSFTGLCIQKMSVIAVSDLKADAELCSLPLASDPYNMRAAAAAPIRNSESRGYGAVVIWSAEARRFSERDTASLEMFAQLAKDALEQEQALRRNLRQSAQLSAIFENASVGMTLIGRDGSRIAANNQFCRILGYTREQMLQNQVFKVQHPDDQQEGQVLLNKVWAGQLPGYSREGRALTKQGETVWCRYTVSRVFDPTSAEAYVLTFVENIDEKRKAEQSRNLLLGEINHRVKNMLAIVQGIAKQLLRLSKSPEAFAEAFESRVRALAQSHDMLTQSSWQPLTVEQIIDQIRLGAWYSYKHRIRFSGVSLRLNPQTSIMLSLLLHELVTNAVKHGALKSYDGVVEVTTTQREVGPQPWLDLCWREECNAEIQPPSSRGLGLHLIERAPRLGLSGTGSLKFTPRGVVCTISFPLFSIQSSMTAIQEGALTSVHTCTAAAVS